MITKIETIELPGFYLAGIKVRTTNLDGKSARDIGELWGRFSGQHLENEVYDRCSNDLYTVYMDYEGDHTGFYTALIGCHIQGPDHFYPGFEIITVPSANYEVYTLSGEISAVVGEAWQEIWKSEVKRAYTIDFDRYTPGEPVRIYVAVPFDYKTK